MAACLLPTWWASWPWWAIWAAHLHKVEVSLRSCQLDPFFSPLGSSRGSRDESRDVARGDGEGGLPLAHVVGELPLVGNLGGPPR